MHTLLDVQCWVSWARCVEALAPVNAGFDAWEAGSAMFCSFPVLRNAACPQKMGQGSSTFPGVGVLTTPYSQQQLLDVTYLAYVLFCAC